MTVATTSSAGELLKEARRRAGLTQARLARRAGVTQSVISAYESGARQPSVPTLRRLVAATGLELAVGLTRPASPRSRLTGPIGRRVTRNRERITRIAAGHGASNVRVFGSVARGQDTSDSDLDLLVDLAPGTGLVGLARLERELGALVETRVEVVPEDDLKPGVARDVLDEAVPL